MVKKQTEGQSVFRIQNASNPKRPVKPNLASEGTGNAYANGTPVFNARKSHKKSRNGCQNCKSRRVKCDETKGDEGCWKCRQHGIECDYVLASRSSMGVEGIGKGKGFNFGFREKATQTTVEQAGGNTLKQTGEQGVGLPTPLSNTSPDLELSNSSGQATPHPRSIIKTSLPLSFPLLAAPLYTPPLPLSPSATLSSLQALHHFTTYTASTCGCSTGQSIIGTTVLSLALSSPSAYLLHAILGLASAHLVHLLPTPINAKHQLADAYHWGSALSLYRREIAHGVSISNMDGILSAVMLVAFHQFHLPPSHSPSFALIHNPRRRRDAMKWLTIRSGFKAMFAAFGASVASSVWYPVLREASVTDELEPGAVFRDSEVESNEELEASKRLYMGVCEVTGCSTPDDNAYFSTLETLLLLRRLPLELCDWDERVGEEYFNKLITFMGRMTPEFRELLFERDEAALVVLAGWLGMMSRVRQWWIVGRAEGEGRGIVRFLLGLEEGGTRSGDWRVRRLCVEIGRMLGMQMEVEGVEHDEPEDGFGEMSEETAQASY